MECTNLYLLHSYSLYSLSFPRSTKVLGGCSREILGLEFYLKESKNLGFVINHREENKNCILYFS